VPAKAVLASTQKLLDRVLFCAFAEDRGLLPVETIRQATSTATRTIRGPSTTTSAGCSKRSTAATRRWASMPTTAGCSPKTRVWTRCGVGRGLRVLPRSGRLRLPPAHQTAFAAGGDRIIDVEILGHIFEQSITDLERLRNELDGLVEPAGPDKHKTRRKKEGAFYTPSFITRYIIEQALGGALKDRFEQLRQRTKNPRGGRRARRSPIRPCTLWTR
jgi:hypothetical protein